MNERILQCSRKCWDEDLPLSIITKRRSKSSDKDTGVCSDRRFCICLGLREQPQEIIVKNAVSKLREELVCHVNEDPGMQTLGANRMMDFTVASRITGMVSENPSC